MKKIALLLALLLTGPMAHAEQSDRFLTIRDFSKGLNTQASPYLIQTNQATEFKNLRPNKTFGGLGKRSINLEYGSPGSHDITGLHRYYQADGDKFLIATGSTKIYVGDDDAGTFTTIGSDFSDGRRFEWVTYKNMAIGMNGSEDPVKWDGSLSATANTAGHRTAGYLVTDLGAPFAQLATGSDLDASKYYQYKIAYYDGTNYYFSNARSNPILTGSSVRNIDLTDIPLGPPGTTTRYVYRTLDNASVAAAEANNTFYKVATIANNTATTLSDSMDDTTASGDAAPTWATVSAGINVTPPKGKYPIIHKERLFIAGNTDAKSTIYWSAAFLPDFFDEEDYEQVRPDDGDEITFLKDFLGILTIGKTNTIQKLYTDGLDTEWSLSSPFSFVGCPAPYSAATTPKGIFYLGRGGLYRFTGQYSDLVSDAVTPQLLDVSQTNIEEAAGCYFNEEYHLAYTSKSTGGTANNRVLVYNFTRDAYALDTKTINVFEPFDAGDDFGILYHGSSTTSGKIFADEGSPNFIFTRLKSEFDAGTYSDARARGTELNPILEIAWTITIDQAVGTINGHSYGASAIIDRPDTGGTWTSPGYQINAAELDQLQWHEILTSAGDVTFEVRTAASLAALSGASWSSTFSNPNGSDISGVTANDFLQVRISLSTTDITKTPNVFVEDNYAWRLFFFEAGSTKESDVLSEWQSGWVNFGTEGYKKLLRRIRVYYEGTAGELNFTAENDEQDASIDFDIDMSVNPDTSASDDYEGGQQYKVFTYRPLQNSPTNNGATGEYWRFKISEEGTEDWKVYAIEILFNIEEVYD